jgi:hypothetical protein
VSSLAEMEAAAHAPAKVNVNRKNLIMSLADSCFEFHRDLERNTIPTSFAAAMREFPEGVCQYNRLIELT